MFNHDLAGNPDRRGVSRLGLGCWPLGGPAHNLDVAMGWSELTDDAAVAAVRAAWAAGIRRFDTADAYGLGRSEHRLGLAIKELPREELFLTSKVGYLQPSDGGSPLRRENLLASLRGSLDRLGTDYLDIYFLHHNSASLAELDEFAAVLDALRAEGVVRAIGARGPHRFARERHGASPRSDKRQQFVDMFERIRPEVVSLRANLLSPMPAAEESVYDWVIGRGATVQVYKPLAQGLLTSSYCDGFPDFVAGDHRERKGWFTPASFPALVELRAGLARVAPGFSPVELALAWVDHFLPSAVVLFGSTDPAHIVEVAQARRVDLDADDLAAIADLADRYRRQVPSYLD